MKTDFWIRHEKAGVPKVCACFREVFLLVCHDRKLMGIGRACAAGDFNSRVANAVLRLHLRGQGVVPSLHVQKLLHVRH